jgi:nitrate reductase gamma subunit
MALLPYLVAYLGIVVFVIAVIARFVMWSKMPMHMRWELYPVAHEGKKAHYGGSYLEELDWWTKKREVSLWGELKVMVPEILFLVALKEHNPKLWVRSFPFHFGLYLLVGWAGLILIGGILTAVVPAVMAGALAKVLEILILVLGCAGLVLAVLGALGLLQRRLTSKELRLYAAPADILNLVLFIGVLGLTFATFVVERSFASFSLFANNLVTFNMEALPSILPAVSIILLMLLMAYIPLTHMSHFVGKYFAYHAIRWNDEPNLPGGKQEKVINELLTRPVTWAAPHIKGDGKKTWADVATEEVE